MNDKTLALIDKMADKLGVAAGHLWEVMVRQAYISGIVAVVEHLVFLAIIIHSLIYIPRWLREYYSPDTPKDREQVVSLYALFSGMALLFSLLGTLIEILPTVTKLTNPEYWALQKILQTISN
jgi:hypothetical protein